MKIVIKSCLLVLVISCLYLTCTPEGDITGINSNNSELKTGTLSLNLPMDMLKTIEPDISMEPVSYDINVAGPDGAAFSITTDQPSVEIPGIDFGEWTVTADAKNIDGTIIGSGETTVTIHVGETTVVDITVTPLDGFGTIDITLNWTAADTEYPSIESQLTPAAGSPLDLDFTITGGNQGTYVNNAIPTGFHTLVVKLMDGNPANITPILTMGAVEIVRIIKDETSSGTFDFTQINQPGGTMQLNITSELNDPIDVTLSGQLDQIDEGGSMTVTASVPPEVGNVTYVWYINGESQDTGESYTVSGLPVGTYRLDVTAISTDGKRAGSMNCEFSVVDVQGTVTDYDGNVYQTVQIGNQVWMAGNLNVGSMFAGSNNHSDNQIIEKFCYDNIPSNCDTYGGLYQWKEAMQYVTTEGAKGICPEGWHIPTFSEMQTLEAYVNDEAARLVGEDQPATAYTPTNETGFSALFAGMRNNNNYQFYTMGSNAYIWSSTEVSSGVAYHMNLFTENVNIFFFHGGKGDGKSVRCLQD